MSYSAEQESRILAEQEIMRSGEDNKASLCQYRNVSCVRCCLPHIGGDSHLEDSGKKGRSPINKNNVTHHRRHPGRYLGPGNTVMKFRNFNPLSDPKFEASQYEDSFPDVGREEMERRFAERRKLFLALYDPQHPKQSLTHYMKTAQRHEGYKYKPEASAGPVSLFLGGSVPKHPRPGELPECQLLGFIDGNNRVGCMAHPLAEMSHGYDGRDQVGFFNHTGGCNSIGCEASREFMFLSQSALKVFDKAVDGMSWYEYSRHATSVLVHYLRSYDHILQKLDERELLDTMTLVQIAGLTNTLYEEWPLRIPHGIANHPLNQASVAMNSLEILSTDICLAERIMYVALDTWFLKENFVLQLQQARDCVEGRIEALCRMNSQWCGSKR